jgi:hypothetical protein
VTVSGPMLIVMTVTVDPDAFPDTTDMSADHGSVSGTCAQERQGKKRSDKSFHNSILLKDATAGSGAGLGADDGRYYEKLGKSHSFQIVQTDTLVKLSTYLRLPSLQDHICSVRCDYGSLQQRNFHQIQFRITQLSAAEIGRISRNPGPWQGRLPSRGLRQRSRSAAPSSVARCWPEG